MSERHGPRADKVRVFLCECGPIIKDAVDLDALGAHVAALPEVYAVERYGALCSPEGRVWLAAKIAEDKERPVVIAACSPREHGATFEAASVAAGANPYLIAVANIREQGTWVTPDKGAALAKSERVVRAAIARARMQEPLEKRRIPVTTDVIVIGAGVAGLTAAKLLAEADRSVVVVEKGPAIGGRTPMLSELFPDNECASCMLEPLMDEVLHHPRIEVMRNSQITAVRGFLGNFTVEITRAPAHADPSGCYGCKSCLGACPMEVDNEWDFGASKRKAIFIPYAGALPSVPTIDAEHCLAARGEACTACAGACPFGNIDLAAKVKRTERQAGAILVATGAEETVVPALARAKRILPAMALERLLNSAGPTTGVPYPPSLPAPRRIAFVHCIDADGRGPAAACSKVCCMAIAKYIHAVRAKLPECEITEILWERCAAGKGFREFYDGVVRHSGVKQTWLAPGDTLDGITESGDTALIRFHAKGQALLLEADLVIYAPPLAGAPALAAAAALLRLPLDDKGFVREDNSRLRPFKSRAEGVYVAGAAQGPMDIQGAAAIGGAAAGAVLSALVPGRELVIGADRAFVRAEVCGGCHTCLLTCPYGAVSFDRVARAAVINDVVCRGCGACAAGCPAGAIVARAFTDAQLTAEALP